MFDVILADPPWWYNSRKSGAERKDKTKFGGGASKHYSLMRDADLLAMDGAVKSVSSDNSALLMWATMPRLDFAIELMGRWGFEYKTTAFVWVKLSKAGNPMYGPGFYTASNAEVVILGVKGSMPPVAKMQQSIVLSERLKHSAKPEKVQNIIDAMYPEARKLEMFARRERTGWVCLGNEITRNDINFDLEQIRNTSLCV